jgi:hypothetical protein
MTLQNPPPPPPPIEEEFGAHLNSVTLTDNNNLTILLNGEL